ncbi:MAG: hypothetical protein MJ252_02510 [archaeon]|nr:hypothetical protein [archaeon]
MNPDAKEQAEKIILAKMKAMETKARKYEDKVNAVLKQITDLNEENRRLDQNNFDDINTDRIASNKEKIANLRKEIKKINEEKERDLGVELNLDFRDDFSIRPKLDI